MFKNSLLIGQNLSYNLGEKRLFSDLNISLNKEKIGLVGRNGIGKSTLVRLLAGKLQPSTGSVHRNGTFGYLPQDFAPYAEQSISSLLGIDQKLQAIERITSGTYDEHDFDLLDDDWDIVERTHVLFAKLGLGHLHLSRKIKTLSGGEITRVVLANLLLNKPDYLILDEPTNNLDAASRAALYDVLNSFKGGVLVISHDRHLLSLMDQIIELSSLGLKTYGGNYHEYRLQKNIEQEAQERQLHDAQKHMRKIKKETQRSKEKHQKKADKGKRKRTLGSQPKTFLDFQKGHSEKTHSKLIHKIEKQLQSAQEKVQSADQQVEKVESLDIELEATRVPKSKIVVAIEHLSFSYPASNPILHNVNFILRGPKRIAITGPNGSGKTTLLKLIIKELPPTSGTIIIGVDKIAYLDQSVDLLDRKKTILENFQTMNPRVLSQNCRVRLASFLFPHEAALTLIENLSSGERLRAALACVLMSEAPPQLIILDEPTNHMDLDSIASIEQALQKYKGALIVVSHDKTFLNNIHVEEFITITQKPGSYDEDIHNNKRA